MKAVTGRASEKPEKHIKRSSPSTGNSVTRMPIKVNVLGGDLGFIGALTVLDLENPEANGEVYDNWASSVKDFPEVINQKVFLFPRFSFCCDASSGSSDSLLRLKGRVTLRFGLRELTLHM